MIQMKERPRRNRKSQAIRSMLSENALSVNDLIAPLFVQAGSGVKTPINSMPGHSRLSLDLLIKEVAELCELGVKSIALFPALDESLKDAKASHSRDPAGLYPEAIARLKKNFPELLVMSDVAMDPYSSDGHDGLVDAKTSMILNDESLPILAQMALCQAQAGSDIIGPSDMMDGRIAYIRDVLDKNQFQDVAIMSYTAKYASAFYGPFREALDSAPKKGDKKTYQMDYANKKEALREARLDAQEGADILMVKPGLSYLDVISALKEQSDLPIAAYNVSGEYAMIKAADERGWIDGQAVMQETLVSFKRAGADVILTYFAKEMAQLLKL